MTALPINSVDCFREFSQLPVYSLLRKLLHIVDIREFGIQAICKVRMNCFYFLFQQIISHFKFRIEFVPLVCDTLLNDFKLIIYDFKVFEVFFVRYHHILKSIDNTNWDVVPFIRVQHLQLVFQGTQLSLVFETLR